MSSISSAIYQRRRQRGRDLDIDEYSIVGSQHVGELEINSIRRRFQNWNCNRASTLREMPIAVPENKPAKSMTLISFVRFVPSI